MNAKCVVPEWLHDVFLGYGDPGAAHYRDMPTTFIPKLDFNDTFISYQHLLDSFPGHDVQVCVCVYVCVCVSYIICMYNRKTYIGLEN